MEFQNCLLKILTLFTTVSTIASLAYATTGPCDFPAIFNFGDSNSDTGGLSAAFGQAPPPNGESYFHRPVGRFSDGRLIIDFIAKSLGLPYLSAYLYAMGSNFSHGANFATAGSSIRPQQAIAYRGVFNPFSLNVQYSQFNDFQSRSQIIRNQGGVFKGLLPKVEDFSRALYTFDIGQNDLAGGFFLNMTIDQVRAYVPDVLEQFKIVVKNVYDRGGRAFWIHNTGPIGCLPYILDIFPVRASQVDKVGCAIPYNEVAQYFNLKLKQLVLQLRKDLPLAALTYVDVYSVKYNLISKAKKYGFMHPLRACCGYGGKYNFNRLHGCGSKTKKNGKEIIIGKSCNNPSIVINWDGVHFTEAGNKWIFDQIVNGAYSDPPVPLTNACHRHY